MAYRSGNQGALLSAPVVTYFNRITICRASDVGFGSARPVPAVLPATGAWPRNTEGAQDGPWSPWPPFCCFLLCFAASFFRMKMVWRWLAPGQGISHCRALKTDEPHGRKGTVPEDSSSEKISWRLNEDNHPCATSWPKSQSVAAGCSSDQCCSAESCGGSVRGRSSSLIILLCDRVFVGTIQTLPNCQSVCLR